jgi:predicted DCC family thiol-disulfide oxidoreductase YuxK
VNVIPNPLILYDGVCGLCDRFVQFVLRHDRKQIFRFASLQSLPATGILSAHGISASDLDTVYVIPNFDPAPANEAGAPPLLSRSDAVIFVLHELGGVWRAAALTLRCFPRFLRDWGYRVIAGNRYRIFGRYATCPVPDQSVRNRFLDL